VFHPSLDPREISMALGMEPQFSWRAGEPRMAPKGRPLKGIRNETYWCAAVFDGTATFAADIDGALQRLAAHKAFLRRVRAEGGRVEFFVGWYVHSRAGETVSHSTLAEMANLGIDLAFDTYSDP